MITVKSTGGHGLDLEKVESLKRWIEYEPECYMQKLKFGELEEQKLADDLTLAKIKELYALIEKIDGSVNIEENNFKLNNPHSFEENQKYQMLVDSIPTLDVSHYASIKLTDKERQFAYNFMKQCNKVNSREMMKYAEKYPRFFVGSYMVELLIHHPKSDYIYSSKNIENKVAEATNRLEKRMKRITWKNTRDRYIGNKRKSN